MTREEMRKRRKRRRRAQLFTRIVSTLLVIVILGLLGFHLYEKSPWNKKYVERTGAGVDELKPDIQVELLSQNPHSRPGFRTERIRGIVIHYTANPGSTAMQNRNYFEGLKDTGLTDASSHFIVGLEGEIVQCVPTWEVAYASNNRNSDTVSIETCHLKEDGKYSKETYYSLVQLTAWLCDKFELTEEDVIRHYDVTGKICPKYFVEDEEAWQDFKEDVKQLLEGK